MLAIIRSEDLVALACRSAGALLVWLQDTAPVVVADAVCPGLALERDRGGTPGVGGASRVLAIIRS